MRHRLEYAPVWLFVRFFGMLPRPVARALAIALARLIYLLHPRFRRVGLRNLEIAFPEKSMAERRSILAGLFNHLGRLLAEVCLFPRYTKENVKKIAIYDGFEHFEAARARGKGVLFMTAHFGGWEIGSFVHSLLGNPMKVVVRALDNPFLDRMIVRYRTLHGNGVIEKGDFARGLLAAFREGETVGVLMDQNMTPPQGVFVDYFGEPACTAGGIAKIAMRTDAAVVPAFTIWDAGLRKYRVHFDPALPLIHTGDEEADIVANTAAFTKVIEDYVRRYPDQWLWVHRRWKTRPEGALPLY